ncbi:MAG: hypothetical protein QNJ20_06195 [Paracoccaceae bacterium]|nr:hypothetical protein [Paracoccaceae bacterium]
MSPALQIGIALGSVAVLIGLMALVRRMARSLDWSAEVQRKLVHIGTGLYALTLPWLFPDRWPVLMLLGVTIVVMLILRLPRFADGGVGAALHGVERQSYGDLLLALAVGVVFLLADQPVLYVLPLAILTLADAAAALTGSAYGRKFFAVEDGMKSLEGSVAFFMTSFCLSMICLLVLSDTPRINVIYLAAIVAAFGTLVEADSWRGFDNFFLPMGLMLFLQGHLSTPPLELFGIMATFLAAIWIALSIGPRLGVPAHTARVYVTAAFLVLTVVNPADAVLPLLAFATHHIAQRINPDDATHPELDCVAAVALMSIFWLVLGRTSGTFNLELYGLTALAMCIAFVTLSARDQRRSIALGVVAAVGGAGLYTALMAPGTANAIVIALHSLIIGAGLAVIVPALKPDWFATARALRVAALAMIVPLANFALQYPGLRGA